MRREDIEIGVEYAETAPYAYGNEPSVSAKKIRFLSTKPDQRLVISYEYRQHPNVGDEGSGVWVNVGHRLVHEDIWISLPDDVVRNLRRHLELIPLSERIGVTLDVAVKYERGLLACERWHGSKNGPDGGYWSPGLALPAAVHRTWEQHVTIQERVRQTNHDATVMRAPGALTASVNEAVRWAQFQDLDLDTLLDKTKAEWKRQDRSHHR